MCKGVMIEPLELPSSGAVPFPYRLAGYYIWSTVWPYGSGLTMILMMGVYYVYYSRLASVHP